MRPNQSTLPHPRRGALMALCLSVLMSAMAASMVNVALPAIRWSLDFSEASLVWVANAYLATFGGCLLLAARLGDLFGHRRLLLVGITLFTLASLGCALAPSAPWLVAARAVQGAGGAIISGTALSQIISLFAQPQDRVAALGMYAFATAGGSSIAPLVGGGLSDAFGWQWIFLANVPLGACALASCIFLVPSDDRQRTRMLVDVAGALASTASLLIATYAIVNGRHYGWASARTVMFVIVAVALLAAFIVIESKVKAPLIPLKLFRERCLVVASVVGVLFAAALLTWSFVTALYLQLVLKLTPLQVGLAFLPANAMVGLISLVVAPKLVTRLGSRRPLMAGLLMVALGLALLARAPVSANIIVDVLPAMLLVGVGVGTTYNTLYDFALRGIPPEDSGVTSGIVTTALTMGGALGLSIVVSLAAARSDVLLASGVELLEARASGYHVAFSVGSLLAMFGALIVVASLPREHQRLVAINASPNPRADETVSAGAKSSDEAW